jgi:maleylacetate reductase
MTVPEVLFVCVHNAGRSQMAAALLHHHAAGRVRVTSAGSAPADEINPAVRAVMAEWGMDLAHEFPKKLTTEAVRAADVVVTMGCGDTCPVFPGTRHLDWQIPDPAGRGVDDVRPIRDEIDARVRDLLATLVADPAAGRGGADLVQHFTYTALPTRIVFGSGTLAQVGDEVARLGRSRALVLAGERLRAVGDRVEKILGPLAAGRFDGAVMHTPVEVTEQALEVLRETGADCVVAVGGGSTTGLAKALAVRTGVDQVVLPTTYAGSEVTPVLGETAHGVKTTRADPAILPETVIYDVELTAELPRPLAVTSAVNALAHAVEALYSPDANPVVDGMALDAVRHLARGLRGLDTEPEARADLLCGAWLAGTCLGAVGMGLHHKLCHTLGGSFGLPHAPTHTVVLPQAMAYNAAAAPEAMRRVAEALRGTDAPAAVFDLIVEVGGPTSLRELGLAEADLGRAAALAVAEPYPNPAPLTRDGLTGLLRRAWAGERPGHDTDRTRGG